MTYYVDNEKIKVPFYEDTVLWDIAVEKRDDGTVMEVLNKKNGKEILIKLAE
ncbi:hypothetical protein [Aequorivita sp. KMM 9714]|uniref:hypothetical protein n=1 Tax=Aequorivita sp. KMM 9714 TaxID=2707173 RepID=UPI0019D6FE1E|nr:hypothetical protein [Aequorivita sp. KMM 9714]